MQFQNLLAVALLAAGAAAQGDGPTVRFNDSDLESLNTTGGPHFISLTTRQAWCTGQRTACSTLCEANFSSNECNSSALSWDCVCGKNNSAPGLEYYASTMPNNLCSTLNGNCMAEQAQNGLEAQQECNKTYVCGSLNITAFSNGKDSGSGGSSASGTGSSGGASQTGSPTSSGGSGGSTPSKAAAAALHVTEHYGAALLSGGLAAAFGLLL